MYPIVSAVRTQFAFLLRLMIPINANTTNWNLYTTISIIAATGGTVNTDKMSAYPGETVRLTINPNAGYALLFINVLYNNGRDAVSTQGTGNTRTFTMPAANVTVTPFFENPTYQAAWAAAKAIIEAATFELSQEAAGTQTDVRYLLADMINELLNNNSAFSILHSSFRRPTSSSGLAKAFKDLEKGRIYHSVRKYLLSASPQRLSTVSVSN